MRGIIPGHFRTLVNDLFRETLHCNTVCQQIIIYLFSVIQFFCFPSILGKKTTTVFSDSFQRCIITVTSFEKSDAWTQQFTKWKMFHIETEFNSVSGRGGGESGAYPYCGCEAGILQCHTHSFTQRGNWPPTGMYWYVYFGSCTELYITSQMFLHIRRFSTFSVLILTLKNPRYSAFFAKKYHTKFTFPVREALLCQVIDKFQLVVFFFVF